MKYLRTVSRPRRTKVRPARRSAIESLESRCLLTGELSGFVWQDYNDDGSYDVATETPLAGWTVFLDDNLNGLLDDGEAAQVSDAAGHYVFSDLPPGEYVVATQQQAGFARTNGDSAFVPPGGMSDNPSVNRNVELLANFPLSTFANGTTKANDITTYVSPSGREYAIIGLNRSIAFVEVTDPRNPILVSHILGLDEPNGGSVLFNLGDQNVAPPVDTDSTGGVLTAAHCHDECDVEQPAEGSTWRDIKTYQEFAYSVVDAAGGGIQVFDLREIDNGFVTTIDQGGVIGAPASHNLNLNAESGFLYSTGSNGTGGGTPAAHGVMIFDLSDPAHPQFAGGYAGQYFHDAIAVTYHDGPMAGREIVYGFAGSLGVTVLDVTNKSNITKLTTLKYPNTQYAHFGALSKDLRYLYVNDELDEKTASNPIRETTTYVLDIQDPANPVYLSNFSNRLNAIDHNPMVVGDYIFEANYSSGLRVFDISQVHFIHEVGFYDTYSPSVGPSFHGAWGVDANLPSGTVVVSDIEGGLFVFDVSHATGPMGTYLVEVTADESFDNINFGSRRESLTDDTDSDRIEVTGDWLSFSGSYLAYQFYGPSTFLLNAVTADHELVYSVPVPATATYEVQAYWSTFTGRATNLPFQIAHADGVTPVVKSLATGGGFWNSLGSFDFTAGEDAQITISGAGANGSIAVDAIRLIQRTPAAEAVALQSALSVDTIEETAGENATVITLERPVGEDNTAARFVTVSLSDPTEARWGGGAALEYTVDLRPENTVPPSGADTSGTAHFQLREEAGGLALDYSFQIQGIDLDGLQTPDDATDDLTSIHLHIGEPDINGEMIFGIIEPNRDVDDLVVDAAAGTVSGTWDAADVSFPQTRDVASWLEQFAQEIVYVNVHTVRNTPGEIRGYLEPVDDATRLVSINAFTNSTDVPITAVDDTDLDGPQAVTIDVRSLGLADSLIELTVNDNEGVFANAVSTDASGFTVAIVGQPDFQRLNLYDGVDATRDETDVQLVGRTQGIVAGSLLWDADSNSLRFVKTGGPLAPDDYTLTIFSRNDSLTDLVGHPLSSDFVQEFSIAAPAAKRLILPDLSRGPRQAVDLDSAGGIPVAISDGDGVLSVEFVLHYDPNLLSLSAPDLGESIPNDWLVDAFEDLAPGQKRIRIAGETPLAPGEQVALILPAGIPATASVGAGAILDLTGVLWNDGAINADGDTAVQLVTFPGDATGDESLSALDASMVARVAVGLDSGFDVFSRFDPILVADVTGNQRLSALDASFIARKAVGLGQDEIPDIPAPLPPPPPGESPSTGVLDAAIVDYFDPDDTFSAKQPVAASNVQNISGLTSTVDGTPSLLLDLNDVASSVDSLMSALGGENSLGDDRTNELPPESQSLTIESELGIGPAARR
ncbi:MAG: choice-of-anchor B family protein [Planctomycetales bacterium]|nr:choice-of-anchor B family protein [Planctomycetales bacterium]